MRHLCWLKNFADSSVSKGVIVLDFPQQSNMGPIFLTRYRPERATPIMWLPISRRQYCSYEPSDELMHG